MVKKEKRMRLVFGIVLASICLSLLMPISAFADFSGNSMTEAVPNSSNHSSGSQTGCYPDCRGHQRETSKACPVCGKSLDASSSMGSHHYQGQMCDAVNWIVAPSPLDGFLVFALFFLGFLVLFLYLLGV